MFIYIYLFTLTRNLELSVKYSNICAAFVAQTEAIVDEIKLDLAVSILLLFVVLANPDDADKRPTNPRAASAKLEVFVGVKVGEVT